MESYKALRMNPTEHAETLGRDAIAVHFAADNASVSTRGGTAYQRGNALEPGRPSLTASNRPSIRISRVPSTAAVALPPLTTIHSEDAQLQAREEGVRASGRGRSTSAPQPPNFTNKPASRPITPASQGQGAGLAPFEQDSPRKAGLFLPRQNFGRFRRASAAARSAIGIPPATGSIAGSSIAERSEYDPELVNFLDVVDPEIATLSTLTNVQNSLFVPDLGSFLERRPTYTLTRVTAPPKATQTEPDERIDGGQVESDKLERPDTIRRAPTRDTITSRMDGTHFAVLPHGVSLADWSMEEKLELNDHVRHMLHSRRAKFRRSLKGFGQYVRRPLGFLITLYATLITLFGLAWVLFLIGWINVGGRQLYIIHVIDLVLVALFAVVGDGLAPFRAIDTYHMIFIAHYHHLTWKLRRKRKLPKLQDKNDLPLVTEPGADVENAAGTDEQEEISVLTPEQQKKLTHHQNKVAKSHTFYKPHETTTHRAFPLHLLIAVVVLLDLHSLFQIALGTCTWAISYKVRPFALTTVILCCSITCNVAAGITISVGDRMTRKKEVVEKMFRQQLTQEAMDDLERKRERRKSEQQDFRHDAED